jgi:hypothetical protein
MAEALQSDRSPTSPPLGPGGGARPSHASQLDNLTSAASVRAICQALGVPEARP